MQAKTINQTQIHFDIDIDDQAQTDIVFVNSLGTDFRIWDGTREALKGQFNMVFHDKRGHGLSTLGNAPHTIETYAADLISLLDHLKCKKAVFVGLSIGGTIVQALYHLRPDLVSHLIVCCSAAKIGTHESWSARIDTVKANGIESIADNVMKLWFSPAFHVSHPDQVKLARTMLARTNLAGYIAACEALRDADYTAQAAKIKVPTLFIAGGHDGSTPPALVKGTADLVPDSKFHLMPDCAHIPCIEQSLKLAELIKSFASQ